MYSCPLNDNKNYVDETVHNFFYFLSVKHGGKQRKFRAWRYIYNTAEYNEVNFHMRMMILLIVF